MKENESKKGIILNLFKEHWYIVVSLLFFSIIMEILNVMYPLILGKILDSITIQKEVNDFIILSICYTAIFLLEKAVFVISNMFQLKIQKKIVITHKDKILNCLFKYNNNILVGKAEDLLIRGPKSFYDIFYLYIEIISNLLKIVLIFYILFKVNFILALSAIILMPIIFMISKSIGKYIDKKTIIKEDKYQKFRTWTIEVLSGFQTITHFNMEKGILIRNDKVESYYKKENKRLEYIVLYMEFFIQLLLQILNLIIYCLSAFLIIRKKMTMGNYIMVFEYFYIIQNSLTKINLYYSELKVKNTVMNQIVELYNRKPRRPIGKFKGEINGDISCKNLSFSYDGINMIIKNITLEITKGEEVTIVAKSGGGKSTLIKLLAGLLEEDQGCVFLGKYKLKEYDYEYMRENVFYLNQDRILLNDTLRENITMGQIIEDESIWNILENVGLKQIILDLPNKLNTIINNNNFKLSDGEYQRLNIARVLTRCPKIIMIDEGMSSLDIAEELKIHDLIKNGMKQTTIINITHRIESLRYAKRILFIHNGYLIGEGTHEQLLKNHDIYAKLFCNKE